MHNLIEIAKIVTKRKVHKIEVLDANSLKQTSKFNDFYEALLHDKFASDKEAAAALYNASPTSSKYRQLKSRFKTRLLNSLFFIDLNKPGTSDYDRSYLTINRLWTLVKILQHHNAPRTAHSLSKKIFKIASKYQFTDFIVHTTRILRNHAAEIGDKKDFEEWSKILKTQQEILNAEIASDENILLIKLNANDIEVDAETIETQCNQLLALSEKFDSPTILYNMYLGWAIRFEVNHEYEELLAVCEKVDEYIKTNPIFNAIKRHTVFRLKKMSAYLHLRDFTNGKKEVEHSLESFPVGSKLWFSFMEYYILLALHTENYYTAYAIYAKARTHSKFNKLSTETKEKWKTFYDYINLMLRSKKIKRGNQKPPTLPASYNYNKFLRGDNFYARSLRILEVHNLIIKVVYYTRERNLKKASLLIDRLKSLSQRSLKLEEHKRTIYFIRLLNHFTKSDFDTKTCNTKYLEKLQNTPMNYGGQLNNLEIIPYKMLWKEMGF